MPLLRYQQRMKISDVGSISIEHGKELAVLPKGTFLVSKGIPKIEVCPLSSDE